MVSSYFWFQIIFNYFSNAYHDEFPNVTFISMLSWNLDVHKKLVYTFNIISSAACNLR